MPVVNEYLGRHAISTAYFLAAIRASTRKFQIANRCGWRTAFFFALVSGCGLCDAAPMLQVSRGAWQGLSDEERAVIQRDHVVEINEPGTFGVIIDTQGVDESTPGTTGGAALGGAIAEASYIDRAFKPGNNYSAKNQLGITILGAMLGSTLDKPAVQQYHFRYALKLSNGEIQSFDSVQASAFRHPTGLCLSIPDLSPISQGICTQTSEDLRRVLILASVGIPATLGTPIGQPAANAQAGASQVICRLGNLAPVTTTAEKCSIIGGVAQ
jgi:hypothetical protein